MRRVPRKLKKKYKKLWEDQLGCKIKIMKSSIKKGVVISTTGTKIVWTCMYRFKD